MVCWPGVASAHRVGGGTQLGAQRCQRTIGEARALARAAVKACAAAVCGAVLTNPLDVLRNEMFKTDLPLGAALASLRAQEPRGAWLARGAGRNLVGVAVPVAATIFLTDQLKRLGL